VARGPAPGWRTRKEPIADDYLLAVINQAGGLGQHDSATGLYGTLVLRGLKDRDEAKEWDLSLYRCALWLSRNRGADISVTTKIEHVGDSYTLRFSVFNKTHGRQHIMNKHGSDRTKWPYDPRRRGTS
jgi:hypothetical protein